MVKQVTHLSYRPLTETNLKLKHHVISTNAKIPQDESNDTVYSGLSTGGPELDPSFLTFKAFEWGHMNDMVEPPSLS